MPYPEAAVNVVIFVLLFWKAYHNTDVYEIAVIYRECHPEQFNDSNDQKFHLISTPVRNNYF